MKKSIIIACALLLCGSAAFAQDFSKATELAKQANEALVNGDFAAAASNFKAALDQAAQCSEAEAAELVENCKKGISQSYWASANDLVKDSKLAEAVEKLKETIKVSGEYGETEIVEKAEEMTHKLNQALAGEKIKAASIEKDPAAKAACFKEAAGYLEAVLAKDPENGKAYLQKGQVLQALSDKDAAIASFEKAKACGQEDAANKQLSIIFMKEANAFNSAGKLKEAVAAAVKSNEYSENANAYLIAGLASNKLKDLKAAKEYLTKYLQLAPDAKNAPQIKAAVDAISAQIK